MKGKDTNCIGIISDQGEAVTTSNLSEYTIPQQIIYRWKKNLMDSRIHFKYCGDFSILGQI